MDKALLVKFVLPVLAVVEVAITSRMDFPLLAPLVCVALVYLTAARIRLAPEGLQFRRWSQWRSLPYDSITDARASIWPGLGSLKTHNVRFPQKRIYFVLEERTISWPGHRTPLMMAIMKRSEPRIAEFSAKQNETERKDSTPHILILICAVVAGFWMGFWQFGHAPRFPVATPSKLYRAIAETTLWLNRPVVLVLIGICLLLVLARNRFRGWPAIVGCWLAAGMLGSALHQYLMK